MAKKYVSEFVKWSNELKKRAKEATNGKLIWNSTVNGTYVRSKHGELRRK